ncbi:uncharacterized protein [Dermacentor albipictus]|uniref:uncharacterized protein isoform X4 n=1 Tax=Dermacentor albipictus TaxID=60249 RepID=UPI0031FE3E44
MAEESNSGHTPPAFNFDDEAMPSTSQEFFEGASGTPDCSTTICDDSFEDLWNAMNSHNDATDVTGHTHLTESGITSAQAVEFRSSVEHAQTSTSRAGMEEASVIPGNIASISGDAWRYQWNTQQKPITDGTYNVDGVTDNGNTSYLHLGFSTSIDHAMPSTSRTGMEQAPAITEGGARIPETTRVDEANMQYHLADSTSTDCGHTHNTETGSTFFTHLVNSSSPVASTSYAHMEERSNIFGNDAWKATGTGGRESISDDAWRYHWNTQPRPITDRTYSVDGTWAMVSHLYHDHARVSEYGSTSYVHQPFSTSIDYATPSTSLTDMEQASAIVEGGARISQTTHVDQWNTQYLMADVRSTDCGSISDDAGLYPWNSQQRPITDGTYNVDEFLRQPVLTYGTRSTTWRIAHPPTVGIQATQIGSTGFTLPVCSSSPMASTSYARLQEPSDIFGNYAWNATGTGGREQQEFSGACSNVSSRQDALHGHTKERTGDTAYTCKASDPVNNSVNHCRNTTGRNHKCVTCGKIFHRASLLATHYRTHTNERPYKCEICEKSFRQSHHRDIHKRTHTAERPYNCKTCGKSFAKSCNLRTHNYTHTDEKPHVCPKCSKPFKTKKNLKHHNLCCGDRAFVCEICNAFFKNNSALDRHRRSYMHG